MGLSNELLDPTKKEMIVNDCCNMIEEQIASKSGVGGMALKAAFAAIKGIKPGYINGAVEQLLPSCLTAVDPIWNQGMQNGDPVKHMVDSSSVTADALLSVTDERVQKSSRQIVKGTYEKFRGSAKKHVEEAVPDFAKVIEKHTKA